MCGIFGRIGPDTPYQTARAMLWAIRHRGPDDWGIWSGQWSGSPQMLSPDSPATAWSQTSFADAKWERLAPSPVVLGHARLSILDLTRAGHQPMTAEDGTVVVFNGEIFNYVELKRELEREGRSFRTASDTEVLLEAYRAWGPGCLRRLNGLFAFAIWNPRTRRLFAARDRLGKKPFYFAASGGHFVFASEIKALWAAGLRPAIDEGVAARYVALSRNPQEPGTFFQGVSQLAAGTMLHWDAGQAAPVTEPYWTLPFATDARPAGDRSPARAARALRDLLDDCVRLRYRADVPVGVALSGGLDSAALLSTSVAVRDREAGTIESFTAVHPDPALNEEARARATLQACPGVRSHFLRTAEGASHEAFLDFVRHHDEPMQRPEIFNQFRFMRSVSAEGVKVLLSGQGSDELFLGYPWFIGSYVRSLISRLELRTAWSWIREDIARTGGSTPGAVRSLLSTLSNARVADDKRTSATRWLRKTAWDEHCGASFSEELDKLRQWPDFHAWQLLRGSLMGLLKDEDRNSMAHGVETRLPYLDYRMVEWAIGLPVELCLKDGWTKHVLREAFSDRLPREIAWSKGKVGFYVRASDGWPGHSEFMLSTLRQSEILRSIVDVPALVDLAGRGAVDRLVAWRCFNLALVSDTAVERSLAASRSPEPVDALART